MQDQPGHKQELTQWESSSAVDGGFAAPGETDLCFRPHLDGRTTGETGVLRKPETCSAHLPLLGVLSITQPVLLLHSGWER